MSSFSSSSFVLLKSTVTQLEVFKISALVGTADSDCCRSSLPRGCGCRPRCHGQGKRPPLVTWERGPSTERRLPATAARSRCLRNNGFLFPGRLDNTDLAVAFAAAAVPLPPPSWTRLSSRARPGCAARAATADDALMRHMALSPARGGRARGGDRPAGCLGSRSRPAGRSRLWPRI